MKWKKLGKIFDPTEHKLHNNCEAFAQSPQALLFDDFVRIYFSTREKDAQTGKFLSHVSYVDMNKRFDRIIKVADHTVIDLGKLGSFDEHGIFPINILRYDNKIWAYTCGWSRRVSVSVETSTGFAISDDDGATFRKIGDGPVMSSSLHEPFLVGDSFVRRFEGIFHMWYIYGIKWIINEQEAAARVYKIGHAVSSDGISWQKEGRQIVDDRLNVEECQALPTVVYEKGKYHMFFCYREAIGFRENKDKGYRIGYAYSSDLVNWVRDDANGGIDVSENDWDSDMMCYPNVFHCDGKLYMLYNGNEFGRYGFGLAVCEA